MKCSLKEARGFRRHRRGRAANGLLVRLPRMSPERASLCRCATRTASWPGWQPRGWQPTGCCGLERWTPSIPSRPHNRHIRLGGSGAQPTTLLVVQGCVLGPLCSRDPDGIDQGAKQRRWSEVSTGSEDNPPSLTASLHGMCSPSATRPRRTEGDQRLRWSSAWWSPPPESNRRPHPYH
jgi:hypothetical protein